MPAWRRRSEGTMADATWKRVVPFAVAATLLACDDARDGARRAAEEAQAAADATLGALKAPRALDLVELARQAFDLLDLTPRTTCGEPRSLFAARVADGIRLRYPSPCTEVTLTSDAASDVVTVRFPASGCAVRGLTVAGVAVFTYSGGTDRMVVAADLRGLAVNGRPLNTQLGYESCGAQTTYSAATAGAIGGGRTGTLSSEVAVRSGLPVIGDTVVLFDARGQVTDGNDVDAVTAEALEYSIGERYPRSGKVTVQTGGHSLEIEFAREACIGRATVRVDGRLPVTVPLP